MNRFLKTFNKTSNISKPYSVKVYFNKRGKILILNKINKTNKKKDHFKSFVFVLGVFILVRFFCMYFFPGSIWQLSVQEKQMLKPNNLKIYANVENKLLNTWQILTLRASTKTVNNNKV